MLRSEFSETCEDLASKSPQLIRVPIDILCRSTFLAKGLNDDTDGTDTGRRTNCNIDGTLRKWLRLPNFSTAGIISLLTHTCISCTLLCIPN